MDSEKLSFQQLQYHFINNRKYFNELAAYWKGKDIYYYNQFISPFYASRTIPIECPYCKQINSPTVINNIKTFGWLIFFFFGFISFGLFWAGVKYWTYAIVILGIGIIGLTFKENYKICKICKTKIN